MSCGDDRPELGGGGNPSAASTDPAPGPFTSVPGRIAPLLTARHCGSRELDGGGRGWRSRVQKPLLGGQVGGGGAGQDGARMMEAKTRVGAGLASLVPRAHPSRLTLGKEKSPPGAGDQMTLPADHFQPSEPSASRALSLIL